LIGNVDALHDPEWSFQYMLSFRGVLSRKRWVFCSTTAQRPANMNTYLGVTMNYYNAWLSRQ